MVEIAGLLAEHPYGSLRGPRRCSNVASAPRWEWRCTRTRCELAETRSEGDGRNFSHSTRRRCDMRHRVWEAE